MTTGNIRTITAVFYLHDFFFSGTIYMKAGIRIDAAWLRIGLEIHPEY